MFANPALQTETQAAASAYPYLSIHTTGPVTSSANESTAPRLAAGWSVSTAGVLTLSSGRPFTGGASGGPAVRVGYWSAATGGSYGGGCLLTGDQAFNFYGEYTVTAITETPTSS